MLTVKQLTLICMDLIAAGHADKLIYDSENPTFAIDEVKELITLNKDGDMDSFIRVTFDEVK